MSDKMEFVDLWYVMIFINDILTIVGSILKILIENKVIFTARVCSTTGGYVFTSVSLLTGGVPHHYPIILPLVPCPFWGGTPSPSHNSSTGSRSLPGGYPIHSQMGGTPSSSQHVGSTPSSPRQGPPGQDLVGGGTPPPSGLDGLPPCQDWMGVPHCWNWIGVPPPHQDWMGIPPPPGPGWGYSPPHPTFRDWMALGQVMPGAAHLSQFPTGRVSCFSRF